MSIRNASFDLGILKSYKSKIKTIAVGNLSTGGTGKTPFTELLIRNLQSKKSIAVVSRGYGRESKGFLWVTETTDPLQSGDEALQIKLNFPSVKVAVCEKRVDAIQKIEKECPEVNLIILDDAFQHRYIKADIYILLSTYDRPYFKDFVLPTGNLRESSSGYKRADFIVMTKCPSDLSSFDYNALKKKIEPKAFQEVFFTVEKYGMPYHLFSGETMTFKYENAFLVSGIANSSSLNRYLQNQFEILNSFKLNDHVSYNKSLINRIKRKFYVLNQQFNTCILTTEKDAVKLRSFKKDLSELPIYILPVQHKMPNLDIFSDVLEHKIMS